MPPSIQTPAAVLVVALAISGLVWRAWRQRRSARKGCGGGEGCGCDLATPRRRS